MQTAFFFLIYVIEAFILLQYTSTLFDSKYSKRIEVSILLFLYTGLCCFSFFANYFGKIFSFLIVNFFFMTVTYQIKWYYALFHASICSVIMGMSELVIYNIIVLFIPDFFADIDFFRNLVLLTVFSKTIYFFILYLLSHLFAEKKVSKLHRDRTSLHLTIVPLTSTFIMVTLFFMCTDSKQNFPLDQMLSIDAILLLIMNVFIFSFNNYIQKKHWNYTEMQLLLQKECDSVEYYKLLLQQNEDQSILIHDIKKHLQSLALLNENREHEKISSYIKHIIDLPELQNNYHLSEHELLNTILCHYKKRCQDKQILFQTDIRRATVDYMVSSDLTSLFCNLLDNAVESASQMPESFIELNIINRNNTPFTMITLSNSCRKNPFSKNNMLFTKKDDKLRHGYGLKSIQRIISNYHGELKMYYDEETTTFHTVITLKR